MLGDLWCSVKWVHLSFGDKSRCNTAAFRHTIDPAILLPYPTVFPRLRLARCAEMAGPTTCSTCSRTCKSKKALRQHMRAHIKKYPCPEERCAQKDPPVAFGTKRDLERHRRIHGRGASRIQCPYCHREVGRLDNLPRHIAALHEDQLCAAAARGDGAVVSTLIEGGADTEPRSLGGETPLSLAAAGGHETIVQLLLDRSADVNSRGTVSRRTPLLWAAMKKHRNTAALLLSAGADANVEDESGRNAFGWAAENKDEDMAKVLLDHSHTEDLLSAGSIEASAAFEFIRSAVKMGNASIVKLMLNHAEGAKITWGLEELFPTLSCPSEATLRLLLDHYGVTKEHPTVRSSWGAILAVPLYFAASKGNKAVVKLLLEYGAETEHKRGFLWETPSSIAIMNGHQQVVELLRQAARGPIQRGRVLVKGSAKDEQEAGPAVSVRVGEGV
ncbi:ankyrin repeat-containing domain protein [Schizothecium vesticola]|uniref:Ankyrin repeat-containing domain protein n=1 Tax=Schizothecium vesticola TaxID=314040 RepID=A0AA40K2V2_9PEZI|nr:ankyrin repeat-containing domain protein [Schizothecium vesticola]